MKLHFPRPAQGAVGTAENRRRTLKNGAYAAALTAAVLAALILLNLVVGAVPAQYTRFDISTGQMFTLTETTRALLDTVDRDVTALYLGITGEEDTNVTELLDRYAGACPHFRWQQRDPNLYPNLSGEYSGAGVGDVVLLCGDNSEVVSYGSLYAQDYSSYYTTGYAQTYFAAEGAITTALANVLRTGTLPLYAMTGHGEAALEGDFAQTLQNAGFGVETLSLVTAGAIPEDAAALVVNAPQVDYTEADVAALRTYLQGGGRLLAVTDFTVATPNLDALLAEYGLSRQPGVLIETDLNYYLYNYPQTYLLPDIPQNDVTAGIAQGMYALAPVAQGIVSDPMQDFEYYPLLTTSDAAYSKVDYQTAESFAQTGEDPAGPFDLAVASADGQSGARVVWLNCANLLDAGADQVVYGGNAQWLGSAVNWLCGQQNAPVIDPKSMNGVVPDVPAVAAIALGILLVIVLPLAVLIAGAVYCLLRRRR